MYYASLFLFASHGTSASPIISGNGSFTFQYMPDLMQLPASSKIVHAHGLVLDPDGNIILTYVPEAPDFHCMIRWRPDGTMPKQFGAGTTLCAGTPHGLQLSLESGEPVLYHANNGAALHKTTLDGYLIWSVHGPPGRNASFQPYKPTWFATPPESKMVYLADGYGSNLIHVFTTQGQYTGRFFGGRGTSAGKFMTCHAITYDPRRGRLLVTDRENHRHQYFNFNPSAATPMDVFFEFDSEFTNSGLQRPCHIRFFSPAKGLPRSHAVVPALEGPVGILDPQNRLVSTIDVGGLLGDLGHKHPHDAIVLPNGDLVVATWNPGRVSYWRREPQAAAAANAL
uniref:Peptidylamidoglycolate lyase n=1 Tax=Chrysotila carterae TaxID=13221 RepID=A0A7S4C079_CHRCT|mmetsp:Transcript_26743/g.58717  ORF Transcript_26743/g.58717 Transcript_26743/m.58717 type:complete len:340 (-) Transcript_26743:150-1169(-)